MPKMLIDTHAHVYHDRLAGDLSDVLVRAREAGVEIILMPAIDVPSIQKAYDLSRENPGLYVMSGIHPSEVKDASEESFEIVRQWCETDAVVAIGESGLDYYWDRSFDAQQHQFLRKHIQLAAETDLPLVLHNREADHDLIRILNEEKENLPAGQRLRGVFHCFGGPSWMVEAASKLEFLVGIGGTVTFKNSGVDAIVRELPLDMIVLETDAPFLAPAPHRGKRNEPSYLALVAEKVAEVKGLDVTEISEITTRNARQLFGV